MPGFPRYMFTVLPKMLVFLGIFDMVDGIWRVSLGHSVSRDSRNACFPKEFDVWACFLRHSGQSGWNVPSFPRYVFTVLPKKVLVFLGILDHCEWNSASLAWPLCLS